MHLTSLELSIELLIGLLMGQYGGDELPKETIHGLQQVLEHLLRYVELQRKFLTE